MDKNVIAQKYFIQGFMDFAVSVTVEYICPHCGELACDGDSWCDYESFYEKCMGYSFAAKCNHCQKGAIVCNPERTRPR